MPQQGVPSRPGRPESGGEPEHLSALAEEVLDHGSGEMLFKDTDWLQGEPWKVTENFKCVPLP